MKNLIYDLDKYQLDRLLQPFRRKGNVIIFWMEVIKLILSYAKPSPENRAGEMFVCFDKMRRVFVHSNAKAFSVGFPFSVKEVGGVIEFSTGSGIEIDSRVSSEVIFILSSAKAFNNQEPLGLIDDLEQSSGDPNTLWQVLGELVQADDGYVRLDHDPDRENGDLHPLNHLDIFYSQSATFKLGLRNRYEVMQFLDVLNIKSDCSFIEGK